MHRRILLLFFVLVLTETSLSQAPANCPTITVFPPTGIVQPGDKFFFTGSVEGDVPKNVSFHWEVSGGKILEGQGTLKISVDGDWGLAGTSVTATLNVLDLTEGCPKSESGTAGVTICGQTFLIEEFGRMTNAAIRTRLTKLFAELKNYPNSQGYIILYGTDREMAARERLIINHSNFRTFPRDRLTIVRGGAHPNGTIYTKLYRIPPGSEYPAP